MKNAKLPLLIALLGLLSGLLLFFPVDGLRQRAMATLNKMTGLSIRVQQLSLGTGLGLGVRGGVLALRASHAKIPLPNGQDLNCDKLILSPQFWPLVMAQLRVAVHCESKESGSITAFAQGSPLWNLEQVSATLELDRFNLGILEGLHGLSPLKGHINGSVRMEGLSLAQPLRNLPKLDWDLRIDGLTTPELASDMINVPSLPLEEGRLKGSLKTGQLRLTELVLGSKNSPLQADWNMDFQLDGSFMPTSGEWRGRLKSDANFEKSLLKDINLDLLFGKVKASGQREFRKRVVNNAAVDLFLKPPEEGV